MFLATTGLTEFWETSDEILLLGPWCLRYDRKAQWERLKYSMLPSPWADPKTIEDAEKYCEKVIGSLVRDLGTYLNAFYGARRSHRYWRILFEPWLLFYVHALYERYVSLKQALGSYEHLTTITLNPLDFQTPIDTADFVKLAYYKSPEFFNLQLYSQVLRALGSNSIVGKEVSLLPEESGAAIRPATSLWTASIYRRWVKTAARRLRIRLTRLIGPKVMLGGVDLNRGDLFRLICAMAFRGWTLPALDEFQLPQRDQTMRKHLADISARDEFTSVVVQSLPSNLPIIYLEGYLQFRDVCLGRWSRTPAVLVSSADWYYNEVFKFLAAEFGERGSRLVGIQHGGGYCTSKVCPQERYELSITDRWLSYGDNRGQGNGIPHPRFLREMNSVRPNRSRQKDILLITTSSPRYPYRFESYPVSQFDTVLEWRVRFIQALPAQYRSYLVVRLKADDFGWCQQQRLIDTFGSLRVDDDRRPMWPILRRTRLIVVEYYGTAYLEMLTTNVPTILFWDPQLYQVRDEAVPYFAGLRNVGILWDSPEAAASKAAAIYDDPWAWWNTSSVQCARESFVSRYATSGKNWLSCWVRALQQEIGLSSVK